MTSPTYDEKRSAKRGMFAFLSQVLGDDGAHRIHLKGFPELEIPVYVLAIERVYAWKKSRYSSDWLPLQEVGMDPDLLWWRLWQEVGRRGARIKVDRTWGMVQGIFRWASKAQRWVKLERADFLRDRRRGRS